MTDLATHYIDEARRQLRGQKRLAEGAIAQLKDEELFVTIDPEANSVAILIKHLAGNMRSRFTDFLTTDGEKPDRFRDQEFELNASTTRADVMRWWDEGWARFRRVGFSQARRGDAHRDYSRRTSHCAAGRQSPDRTLCRPHRADYFSG